MRRATLQCLKLALIALAMTYTANAASARDRCSPKNMAHAQTWFNSVYKESDWKPLPGCPGFDSHDPGIANFVLGGIAIDIPRDYLNPPSTKILADGAASNISFAFKIEDLSPPGPSSERSSLIEVTLRTVNTEICYGDKKESCVSPRRFFYLNRFGDGLFYFPEKVQDGISRAIVRTDEELEGTQYFWRYDTVDYLSRKRKNKTYFFGEINAPIKWFECDGPDYCKGHAVKDHIHISYEFHGRSSVRLNDPVLVAVQSKLREFCRCTYFDDAH